MYEVPVKIYNISNKTKSVNIKHPHGLFKVDTDKKNKHSQISPGLHLEILVIFETDQNISEDQFDQIVITSENDFKLILPLKAYLPQPLVQFEPLINLGFVPVGTKKIETIQFLNDGAQATRILLKMETKSQELKLDRDTIELPMYSSKIPEEKRKQCVTIIFEPTETQNLHEKIQVVQITGDKSKDLGFIEIIATSVVQQMSIVFEEGGGPQTDINFGLLYHGQKKECSAFLVNNGPKEMSFKFNFHPNKSRKDFNDNYDDDDFASTPEEAGLEMTQRILSAEPVQGFVKPYSQIPIKFLCNTKIKKQEKGWTVTLSPDYDIINKDKPKNLRDQLNKTEHFQSLAAVKFEEAFVNKLAAKDTEEDFCKTITVYMEVKALFPDITIDKTSLNFWECNLKEKKVITITITNKNDELPIDFNFNKIPHFTVEPSKGVIRPSYSQTVSQMTVNVYFHPENIGKFADVLVMKYVNDLYQIPIRIFGVCKGGKKFYNGGLTANNFYHHKENDIKNYTNGFQKVLSDAMYVPDELALDFTKQPFKRADQNTRIQKFHKDRLNEVIAKIQKTDELKGNNDKGFNPSNELIKNFEEHFKVYTEISNHKTQANNELVKMRKDRKNKSKTTTHIQIDPIEKLNSVDQLLDLPGNKLDSPRLKLPEPKDTLWVIKPIGQYEPIYMEENIKKQIGKTPDDMPDDIENKKVAGSNQTSEIPRTHQEIRECNLELTGEDLQKIQVGSKELNFGQVFKNSEKSQTFWVKNNHRNYIFVKLEIDSNMPDLQRSYPKSHVIGPGELQGFKITVYSNTVKKNIYPVKYTINYKHSFKVKVQAEIILVKLELQNSLNKFVYRNDKLEKDKVDMCVTQKLRFFNGGNAAAEVRWEENKEKAFKIIPMRDTIQAQTEKEFAIVFNPFDSPVQKEKYPDEIKMNIVNGEPVKFQIEAIVSPCNVIFYELPNDTINFEMVHTGVPNTKFFNLKNETNRVVTAYQIQNPLPEILTFKEPVGFLTDKLKSVEVTIVHKEPNPEFVAEVPILIRGGKKLTLIIKANVVQPEVFIVQEKFDFGGVSFNEPTMRLLTFRNNSKLEASVVVNLNSDVRLRDFKLVLPEKDKLAKEHLIKALEKEKKEESFEEDEEDAEDSENNEESEEENRSEDLREFIVNIPAGESLNFEFIFCANSFDNDSFDFYTNFKLLGASEEYKGLKRHITGQKMESVITISDMLVKFPKTFIYENTKNFQYKDIKIGSVQHNKSLKWEFLLTDEFIKEGIFNVIDSKGEIPAHQDLFVTIKLSFTPHAQKEYKSQVVLRVTDSDGNITDKTIRLEGEGLLPRLYFDKRELILPIVPLGFESSIKFKIKNEGYENEEISYQFESYPQCVLPIEFNWLEKNHTIGVFKNELRGEVKMVTNKPITFTTKLIFFDKEGQQFPIQVAGTCDNCLFTNFSFFQRTDRNTYDFTYDKDTKAINLKKNFLNKDEDILGDKNTKENARLNDELDDEKKSEKNSSSYVGSSMAKNSTALLGYNKISTLAIEQNCKMVKKYLKKIHLDDNFKQNHVIKVFPDDIVKDNGKVIYILVKNLIGKEPPDKIVNLEQDLNKRALQIREQYCKLIRFLQECGACLNTVFPEYLLDLNLYKRYISLDQSRAKVLDPKWEKSKSLAIQWRYYHKMSWVLLVYQILKIFYLSRVNHKKFLQVIKHLPPEIQQKYNSSRIPPSNVYSPSEILLLRWVNACFEAVNPGIPRNAITFSKDFSDSSLLTSIILSYFPKEEKNVLKRKTTSIDAKQINYNMILSILKEYGIYTYIKNFQISPTSPANAREMVLFLTMLFQNLQHFYPKDTIQFSCILGDSVIKAITLYNPTNKILEYAIKYEGNDCFIHPPGVLDAKIEPGKEFEYQITFKSKLSTKVDGRVYFINRKPGWSSQAAPIVYNLVSNITGRRSIDYKIISTNLYSQFAYKLQVKLPFPKEKGEFEVRIEQKKKSVLVKKKGRNVVRQSASELLYKVFFLRGEEEGRSTVKFSNPDGTAEVTIYFLPVELETYECNVIFTKESVGEFQYTIEGRVEKPMAKRAETIEETCNVDEAKEFFLELNVDNIYLKNAVEQLRPMEGVLIGGKPATVKSLQQKLLPSPDKMNFSVESSKPFYIVPSTIFPGSIPEPPPELKNKNSVSMINNKKNVMWLKVKFSSKVCMVYEGDITLVNLEKPNDIRIYKLYVDVKPKEIRATLEFFCPVKETIIQKIPIDNKSDKDWMIKAEITGQTNGFFKVDSDKRIPKHSITDIMLTFCPIEKINVNGMLKLINNYTSEKYFYTLIGNVEEPLAEGNIEITNINAKETVKKIITIDNPLERDVTYTVETDLDDVISGLSTFVAKAQLPYSYEMKIRPLLGKIYFGRIIFRDDHKGYKWYTIRVEAKTQIQPQTIEMRTKIRKGIFIEINLENPTSENVIFRIDFDSDLFLFGDKDVKVNGNSTVVYKLLFAPLKVGVWENVMLHIYNDRIGEFLYKLKLVCEEQPVIFSEIIKAELGKYADYAVMLENPTMDEIEVKSYSSNEKLFKVLQEKIFLPSGVKKEILIRYTPSSLDGDEEGTVKFETKKIGKWEYHLRGRGIPPTQMETTYVRTFVGGVASGQVNFKNPLNERITVNIELKCPKFPEAFSLLLKKTKHPLDPNKVLPISFTFNPQMLTKYSAELFIYISKTLFWKYPIEGITEVKSKGIDFTFKTKAKKIFETKIFLDLSNLLEKDIDFSDFVYILNIKEEKYKTLINKCLSINFVDKKKSANDIQNANKLPLDIKFYPLRPFKTDIEFVLRKKSGGQWIYNIILEATEPDPDDIIHIKSSLNKQSFVAFKLQNIFTKDAKFVAYFSHDSSSEFSVTPREGTLDQNGRDGTQFVVCYLPVEYGKIKIGKLIIETDEVQWVFEVRGTHLDYKPPEIKKTNLLKQTKASENRLQYNENIRKEREGKK